MKALAKKDWVTLANACCGFLAIMLAKSYGFWLPSGLIVLAVVFDWADGRIARRTRSDEFGKQLDSLADALSFGVAPAYVVLNVFAPFQPAALAVLSLAAAVFYVCCALVRLACYNIRYGKKDYEGLPSPAAAIALLLLSWFDPSWLALWFFGLGALMVGKFTVRKP